MTVERVRVGEVLQLHRRAVHVTPDARYREVGIRSFGRGIFHKEPVAGTDLGSKRVFQIEPGDLVISNVFAWEGAIAVATEAETGMIGSHRFMTFRPKDDRAHIAWLAWFFLSEPGLELVRLASPGSAGRNRTLAIERFEALEIPLPSIDEQRRIAARLELTVRAASAVADMTHRAQKLTTALAVSLSTRPDLDSGTKDRAGWKLRRLADVLTQKTAAAVAVERDGEYQIAGVYSFGRGVIDRGVISGSQTSYKSLTRLDEDDVLFSKLGAWEGAVAVVPSAFAGFCVSSEFPAFEVDRDQMEPAFFSGIVRSPEFWALMNSGTQGSMARRKRISPSQFLSTLIWLPPVEHQAEAAELMRHATLAVRPRKQMTERLTALVPAVMNEVFSGLR